jgi:hypothetical protein
MITKNGRYLFKAFTVSVFALGSLTSANRASAHVDYIFVNASGGSASAPMKRFGWIDGTDADLGDSHQVSFFYFHLNAASLVDISMTSSSPQNELNLNPAFTLYAGLLGGQAHDDTTFDPLNPVDGSFNKIASTVDNGLATDALGRVSPFRDTANINFKGQFNALGTWSMATDPGPSGSVWRVIEYLAHKNDTPGNESLLDYLLPAGDYTIIAGGSACNAVTATCTAPTFSGTITVNATPPAQVPIPTAANYLLEAILIGLSALARFKMKTET